MTDKEKLEKIKKLADDMYYAAANLGPNVGSGERLRKTMEEYHKFIIHEFNEEEPTIPDIVDEHFDEMLGEDTLSGDLEEEAEKYLEEHMDGGSATERSGFKTWGKYIARHFAEWQKQQMLKNTADAMIGLPYENKDGGYTHLVDVSRPLPVGNNKIAIIFKED